MIEENILGLCVKNELDPLTTGLESKHFSNYAHQKAWDCLLEIRRNKQVPDLITVSQLLETKDSSIDWFNNLANIANNSLGISSAENHVSAIKKNHRDNEIARIGHQMASESNKDINIYIRELMSLNQTEQKYLHSFCDAAEHSIDEIEKVMKGESKSISTGLADIDKITGGLHNSDLVIVAARPAMGKTAFLLNMAAANKNRPMIFSTEQSRIQAMWRMFSIEGNVAGHKIRAGDISEIEFAQIGAAMDRILDSNGWIYDKSGPTMTEIEATAREVYQNHGCTAIYLDYLQRIKHENQSLPRHEQVGDIAMRLKELARELNIPVVALAQVSRKVESRTDRRPTMGDIKDSGTIEQEADSIMTLYRDEVYNEDTPDKGICEVTFEKNRHGGTGTIRTAWIARTMQFKNLAEMQFN